MAGNIQAASGEGQRSGSIRTLLLIALLAFVVGILATVWILRSWDQARTILPAAETPAPTPTPTAVTTTPPLALPAAEPIEAARVIELEDRIDRVSERARLAAGNAARAEGLLVAFAARRAVDRGAGLGYVEAQLRERFGATQPRAVATIIAASRQPVTLDALRMGLEDLAPTLTTNDPDEGWWPAFQRQLSSLFIVRRAGTPSPAPNDRLKRARRALEGGNVEAALAEVARLPGREQAEGWITAARRYIQAHRALDIIEAAAILTPIEQRAPIAAQAPAQAAPATPSATPSAPQQ